MRFKKQFEFHKVPEWDGHYFRYQFYLEKIEGIVVKMKRQRLRKIISGHFDLSESHEVVMNEDMKDNSHSQEGLINDNQVDDESLSYSFGCSSTDSNDMETPLISFDTEIRELLVEFLAECKDINTFYEEEKERVFKGFQDFHSRFMKKLDDQTNQLDLSADLKQHRIDGLGYSSCWVRQFIEYYSKL